MEDKENPRNLSKEEIEKEKKEDEIYIKRLEVAQYQIRGKPDLYAKEIALYSQDFQKFFTLVKEQPLLKNKKFAELTVFLSRVAHFFKTDLAYLQDYIQEFMENYSGQMNPFLRKKMISSYMIMRAQNLILPYKALTFLFKQFQIPDKEMRKMISSHIINDLKRINKHHKNEKINKQIQNFIFEILKKNSDILAKRSLQLMIQMYKKTIWNDTKTINIIAQGCFNDYYKVRLTSCHFLIETTEHLNEVDTSDSEDEEAVAPREKIGAKKTRAKAQKLEKEKKKHLKKQSKKLKKVIKDSFFPIDQIYNPQEFTEKLFSGLKKNSDKFATKLVILALIARMINRHKLILISFYSFLQKYIVPHQKEVTKILAYLAEATHELIPFEDLAMIIKHLVDNFVNQRCTEQAMTQGLNTIREMCSKNVYLLDKFTLNYLSDYWSYKNKNVSKAAKSLINLYREKNPMLLERKYRGRYNKDHKNMPTTQDEVIPTYTIDRPLSIIPGSDLLDEGNDIQLCSDRILTDEDFRKIRFLQQKKIQQQIAERNGDISESEENEYDSDEEGDDEEDEEEEMDEEEEVQNDSQGEEDESDISELESGDEVEENDVEEDDYQEIGDEEDGFQTVSEGEEEEGDEKEEVDEEAAKLKKERLEDEKSKKMKMENQKRKKKQIEKMLEDYSDYSSEEENGNINPNGFLSEEVIKAFRKKKSERKKEEREQRELDGKSKYKHQKKEKGGGTTNTEKLKNKPLLMVMEKKHKIKKQQENKLGIKTKIKQIKNQLGHVRSKKQFQNKTKKQQQKKKKF